MALTAQQVQQFYIGYYARPADPVGLTYWQTQDEAAALKGFSESAEFTNQFTGLSTSQQVTKVYNNLLGRAPDAAGLLYWSGELTAGRETIGTLVLSMTKNALGKDVTTIQDRVSYSNKFTAALDTPAEINAYAGTVATQAARDALLKVVSNSVGDHTALNAEVMNIDATIAAIVAGGGAAPAQTFTLTTGVDFADVSGAYRNSSPTPFDFKFTSANETVSATELTLNAADSLSDGSTADNDVLNLVLGAGGPGAPAAISNIETINLKTSGVTVGFVDLSGVTGAKVLNVSGPSGAPLFIGGVGGVLDGTGITTIDASGVTSAVNGVQAGFTAATTAALKFTGSNAADVFVGGNGADTINGNAGDDFLVGGAGADTIDGGAGIDNILGGTNNDTINGGDGNDIITGDLGNDVINGGAGNDTINAGGGQGGADKITGGTGNDAITLTGGPGNSETVIFEAAPGAAGNGLDTITGLAVGSVAAGGDVLDFKAFLGGAASFAGAAVLGATINGGVGYSTAVGENVVVINDIGGGIAGGDGILNAAELAATTLTLGANAKVVIIYDNGTSVAGPAGLDQTAYYVTTDVNGAIAAVTQVGVFEGSSGLVYTAAQFA